MARYLNAGAKGDSMFRTLRSSELEMFRVQLKSALSGPGVVTMKRTLSTPGGAFKNAELLWNDQLGLWAYLRPRAYRGQRWLHWFGVEIGDADEVLQPNIEINLARQPSNKQIAGRSLIDDRSGDFYLGHKGLLGGGRGGQMGVQEFSHRVRGFVREPIQLGADRTDACFVIGALQHPDFPLRLKAYVEECRRLRVLARSQRSEPPPGGSSSFSPEHDKDGTGSGRPATAREIKRIHGRVVNALQERIGKHAFNSSKFGMRPDLYLEGQNGSMKILFEVKASSDTQSWFSALGQLVVYGAESRVAPLRVLVCPTRLQNPAFSRALEELKVSVVTFTEQPGKPVEFFGLEDIPGLA